MTNHLLHLMRQVNFCAKTFADMNGFDLLHRPAHFSKTARSMLCLMALITSISACETPYLAKGLEPILPGHSFYFAPGFSDSQKNRVRSDFEKIQNLEVSSSKEDTFEKVFGPKGGKSVIDYLEIRTHYFLTETKLNSSNDGRVAVNESSIWLSGLLTNQTPVVTIGENPLPVRDPRIGIVSLIGYLDETQPIPQMRRIQTLVHEARHSDCTGGLTDTDYASFLRYEFGIGSKCLHSHVICPAGHPLEGLPACDPRPWGAYSMGAVFSDAVSRNCVNCTEKEKQVAMMASLDSLSRILDWDSEASHLPLEKLDLSSSTKLPSTHPLIKVGVDSTEDLSENEK